MGDLCQNLNCRVFWGIFMTSNSITSSSPKPTPLRPTQQTRPVYPCGISKWGSTQSEYPKFCMNPPNTSKWDIFLSSVSKDCTLCWCAVVFLFWASAPASRRGHVWRGCGGEARPPTAAVAAILPDHHPCLDAAALLGGGPLPGCRGAGRMIPPPRAIIV